MQIKSIKFPSYFEDIKDIEKDNIDGFIDVFIEVEEGYTYVVTVATVKNIEDLMAEENMNYFQPGYPFIIVKQLTKKIIKETIYSYAEDRGGYWLKLSHFGSRIDETVFNELQADQRNRFN